MRRKIATPVRRHDAILSVLPTGAIIFPGTGIQDNLADKARAMGVRPMDFRDRHGSYGRQTFLTSAAPRLRVPVSTLGAQHDMLRAQAINLARAPADHRPRSAASKLP